VRIYADYVTSPFTAGTKVRIYSQKFYVCTKADYYSKTGLTKGQSIGLWALTRLDDPYSMSDRGSSNYTDCSYLTLRSVRQALGSNAYSEQPRADLQYKYLVKKGKTIKQSALKMGDMVFFANGSSWYYKSIGHIEVYLGNDLTAGAGYPGYCLIDTYKNTCKTIYYGRPY
jgi:cell wall-associated NlpC family hydrolase